MSDLIAGTPTPSNILSTNYPFSVVPTKQILKGDPLWVYFEVYHLSIGSGNKAQYEVEFKLQRLKQRRFRKDKMETVSQKSMFDSETSTTKQSIAFDVKDLEPGSYDFEVEITDKLSGQKKLRAGNFAVIEQK